MDPFDLRKWQKFREAGGASDFPCILEDITIDSRKIISPYTLFVALQGSVYDGHQFVEQAAKFGARYAIVKKGWSPPSNTSSGLQYFFVDDPLVAFQEIAQAYRRQLRSKVIAIAGSFGKTMVKDLLLGMLNSHKSVVASPGSYNSQIGVPLSLLTIKQEHEIALIEAAFSKEEEMEALVTMIEPDHAILTSIGKKHLATLGNLETITAELIKMFLCIDPENWVLLPKDEKIFPFISQIKAHKYFWDLPENETPHAKTLTTELSSKIPYRVDFPDGTQYLGQVTSGFYYFLDLINISAKAAWLLGATSEMIQEKLKDFSPEPMRTEIWKSENGITFINDAYCADSQSIDRTLKYFKMGDPSQRKTLIFGGFREKGGIIEKELKRGGHSISQSKLNSLILYGSHDFNPLIQEVEKKSPQTVISVCKDYTEVLSLIKETIHPNDTIVITGEKKQPLDMITRSFNDCICNNQCIINLAAIQANIETIRKRLSPKTRIMVVVKALAYGTNDIQMARFLSFCGIDILGVSYVEEGVSLKKAGVSQSIFVINAAPYEAHKVVKWDLEVGVSNDSSIIAIAEEAEKQNKKIKVHLHIDTGMSRFGCRPEEALLLAKNIQSNSKLILEGIMTHFSSADDPQQDEHTLKQAEVFQKCCEEIRNAGIKFNYSHAANSSGSIRFHFPQFNMVRIGLAVYGLYSSEAVKNAIDLRLAHSLVSRIVGINICHAGETVSYGRTFRIEKDSKKIAIIPIGYFDGLHRNYSGKGFVCIRGHKVPMVGKICMDFTMVDVTNIPNVSVGDSVLIFGEDEYGQYLSPEELALKGDSIIHELITCLGPRIQRIFVYEEAQKTR